MIRNIESRIGWVSIKETTWRRRRGARSLTSQGRAEPLCARIESANREVSERKADLWPRSFFFLRGPQGAANGQDSWGFFKDAQGFGRLDAGSRASFNRSRPPPPWTSVFHFSLFLYDVWPWETWNIVDQNWLERICPICCWERWSWVGDNNPSRSRLLSIWSKGGLMYRFVIGRCHRL